MDERLQKINDALQRCEKAAEKLVRCESALRRAALDTVDELDRLLNGPSQPATGQQDGANG